MNSESTLFIKNLLETVTLQCKNNLKFKNDIKIQGMLAVTMDSSGILLIPFDENWSRNSSNNGQGISTSPQVLHRVDANEDFKTYDQYPPTSPMFPSYPPSAPYMQRGHRGSRRGMANRIHHRNPTTPKNAKIPQKRFLTPQPVCKSFKLSDGSILKFCAEKANFVQISKNR